MAFLLSGLAASEFEHLFGKSETELKLEGAVRVAAGEGFPCRVTLRDAEPERPRWEPQGSPGRMWRMLRHRLTGR